MIHGYCLGMLLGLVRWLSDFSGGWPSLTVAGEPDSGRRRERAEVPLRWASRSIPNTDQPNLDLVIRTRLDWTGPVGFLEVRFLHPYEYTIDNRWGDAGGFLHQSLRKGGEKDHGIIRRPFFVSFSTCANSGRLARRLAGSPRKRRCGKSHPVVPLGEVNHFWRPFVHAQIVKHYLFPHFFPILLGHGPGPSDTSITLSGRRQSL